MVNGLQHRIKEHYRRYLPERYAAMSPADFRTLENQTQAAIETVEDALQQQIDPNLPDAQRIGQYQAARQIAEEIVLREVLIDPSELQTRPDSAGPPPSNLIGETPEPGDETLSAAMQEFANAKEELSRILRRKNRENPTELRAPTSRTRSPDNSTPSPTREALSALAV